MFFTAILIGIAIGLVVGRFTARSSANRDPIYGGTGAKVFHYLTASIATGSFFALLAGLFLLENRWFTLAIAATMIALMYLCATIFATIERPAREAALAAKVDRGWTEEDARTSGL
ncbi:MAG: hypothetical protein AAF653_05850 [Chloroflexota bacterium]